MAPADDVGKPPADGVAMVEPADGVALTAPVDGVEGGARGRRLRCGVFSMASKAHVSFPSDYNSPCPPKPPYGHRQICL